jgi:hypothetical protein
VKTTLARILARYWNWKLNRELHRTARELHEVRSYGLKRCSLIQDRVKHYEGVAGIIGNNNLEAV